MARLTSLKGRLSLPEPGMNAISRVNFLMICACFAFGAGLGPWVSAAETNSIPSSQAPDATAQSALNAYLRIQEQLYATQLAIESNRQETAAAAQRDAADMMARIQLLEQTIAAQRNAEIEAVQKAQQLMLVMAGVGMIGLAIMLLMVYFQSRAVIRLAESSASRLPALAPGKGRALPVVEPAGELAAPARTAVELSNARLLGVVERLEKRILELEQTGRVPLSKTASSAVRQRSGAPSASGKSAAAARDERIASLLAEGQSLLEANKLERALDFFDQALAIHPKHPEALIKKGGALEKLSRFDEAIACYDHAIEADGSTTTAYLHKGGLFNRLARYDEALQCYEQALRTQEKGSPREKAAP